jgi:proliferating cell nuclear antigen
MVCVLELKTTQSVHIRTLIDSLNALLTDVNITFYPFHIDPTSSDDKEKKIGGVVIKELNKTSSILIHCKLDADQFEHYEYNYKHPKLTIGINLNNFLKCIKCMTNFDTMTWKIDDEDINKLIMILESEKEIKTFKMNLMDLEDANYEIEPVKFPYSIILPTQDFQNYCKNMMSVTDKIDIKSTSDNLFLSGKGELGVIDFQLTASNVSSGLTIVKNTDNVNEIVQGTFELKYLIIFTRCSSLCSHVNLFLKNNYPLIVQYSVAKLGQIKFVLSQSKPKLY